MADSPQGQVNRRAAEGSASGRGAVRARQGGPRRIPFVLGLIMVVLLGAAVYLVWDQWFNHDDAADIQGQWRVQGSEATINIDADHIKLTNSVIYSYSIDTFAKTITVGFSDKQGESSYEFSDDRTTLTISDENLAPDSSAPEEVNGTASTVLVKVSNTPDMSVTEGVTPGSTGSGSEADQVLGPASGQGN